MPWKAFPRDDEWCVYRIDSDGEPMGETLGCHDSKEAAQRAAAGGGTVRQRAGGADQGHYETRVGWRASGLALSGRGGSHVAQHLAPARARCEWQTRSPSDGCGLGRAARGLPGQSLRGPEQTRGYIEIARSLRTRGNARAWWQSTDGQVYGYTLGGWGVIYGSTDLEGERFIPETDFWFDKLTRTPPVLYQHGMDAKAARQVLGKAMVDERDIGVWVETQIALSNEYADAIRQLAEEGRLGWSSGAVGHLVERDGATITSWPIAEFSLTPTPAEPRTLGVSELRVLAASEPAVKAILPEDDGESSADATTVKQAAQTINVTDRTQEIEMVDKDTKSTETQGQEQLDPAAFAEAAMKEFKGLLENEPAQEGVLRYAYRRRPSRGEIVRELAPCGAEWRREAAEIGL